METISLNGNINNFQAPDTQDNVLSEPTPMPEYIPDRKTESPVASNRLFSDASEKNRTTIIRKLRQYAKTFPLELEDLFSANGKLTNLQNMTMTELETLLSEVQYTISTARSANAIRSMFLGSVQISESIGPYMGLDLRGLAGVCSKSQDVLLTVDEIAIKYGNFIEIDPIHRLGVSMLQLIIAVDQHNKTTRPITVEASTNSDNISPETKAQFSDL